MKDKNTFSHLTLGPFKKNIRISYRALAILAYVFLLCPIFIFFLGWLKPVLGIPLSVILLFGFIWMVKKEYGEREPFELSLPGLILLLLAAGFWVYTSGVGGFWLQREDWHWRNAVLRDLIDYTWPVVYPKTGDALVYYFNYFLPPAVVGKLFGREAANAFLMACTWLGICISMLLICKTLDLKTFPQIMTLVLVFIVWSGLDGVWYPWLSMNGLANRYGHQYSSNNTLLQWVTNQTIAPWIAVPLFWDKRKISTYVFLGMCVLASAPLPFVGLFAILAVDGLLQIKKEYAGDLRAWLKDVFSLPNLCAMVSILTVYGAFFVCNTASNGSAGVGGFGLLIPPGKFGTTEFIVLASFLFFHLTVYLIPSFPVFQQESLFWTMCISLLLIPFFRLGTGNDFGMRTCIPAQFVLMMYLVRLFTHDREKIKGLTAALLVICFSIITFTFAKDWISRFDSARAAQSREELLCDGMHSFSNKTLDGNYCGGRQLNFLCEQPGDILFFSKLCKGKTEQQTIRDISATEQYLQDFKYDLCTGHYCISPAADPSEFLTGNGKDLKLEKKMQSVFISDSTVPGSYEFGFPQEYLIWNFAPKGKCVTFLEGAGKQRWGDPNVDKEQLFMILKTENGYAICWQDQYALTYQDGKLTWEELRLDDSQCWEIEPVTE